MRSGVVPLYVVCDASYSMADHVAHVNGILRELRQRILDQPGLAEAARVCVISFSDSARVEVPLCRTSELTENIDTMAAAATNFASAFALVRDTIERDIASLVADSCHVHQPTVVFLSDGQATDPAVWSDAYQRLIDPAWAARPRIVALAVGEADLATIRQISTVTCSDSGLFIGRVVVENVITNLSAQVAADFDAVVDPV
jgi:uncharacterized protein YegL